MQRQVGQIQLVLLHLHQFDSMLLSKLSLHFVNIIIVTEQMKFEFKDIYYTQLQAATFNLQIFR